MVPRNLLATAPSLGGGAPSWSWYVPVALMAVVTAVVLASMYFRKTVMHWAFVLCELGVAAVLVAAVAGVDGADEIAASLADPVPKDYREFIVMGLFVVVWNLIANARKRRRDDPDDPDDRQA
jgi:hypothetical protein